MKIYYTLILCFLFTQTTYSQEVNRALNAFGMMSSQCCNAPVERAIDGDTNGNWGGNSVAHTESEEEPWVQVDIGFVDMITHVTLYNRTDCCGERLNDYHVFISENPFVGTLISELQSELGVWEYANAIAPNPSEDIIVNQNGRYVRFQVNNSGNPEPINIAEIEVYAENNGLTDQRITFDPIDRVASTASPINLVASSDSGLPVTLSIISGPATVDGSVLTLNGLGGVVVVQADQSGNGTYNPAPPVQQTFEVIDGSLVFPETKIGVVSEDYSVKMTSLQAVQIDAGAVIDYPDLFEIIHVEFRIDGQPITAYLNDDLYSILWTPSAYGSYSLSVEAFANTGTSAIKTVNFSVEDNPTSVSKRTFDHDLISFPNAQRSFTGTYTLPSGVGAYDQLVATLSITCPTGGCDPWDRVAWVEIQRPNGEWVEIIRYITPYGVECTHSIDLSDFMYLLQGEVTLRMFIDTWAQGWDITLDFDYQAGTPQYVYSRIDKVWDGQYPFGDYANLQPVDTVAFTHHDDTEASKLKLVTTGHGWDTNFNTGNAAEFFHAIHNIKVNGLNTFTQDLWATCNPNPDGCQPQFGTWQFNRAGWCPGAIANVYDYDMTFYRNIPNIQLSYIFQESYMDLCHPNHPDCVTGVTCQNCNQGFNPHYYVAGNLISYSNLPLLDTSNPTTGIEDVQLTGLVIFPNPSNGQFQITSQQTINQININVIDVLGRTTYSVDLDDLNQYTIDLTNHPSGNYFIQIVSKEGTHVEKVTIQ